MTWAELLAAFNFAVWLLPIILRSWIAWRFKNVSTDICDPEELRSVGESVKRLNLRGKRLKIGDGDEKPGSIEK